MKQRIMLVLAGVLYLVGPLLSGIQAETVCRNEVGTHDGYRYEMFIMNNEGSACMTLGYGGTYSVVWSDVLNMLARTGQIFGSTLTHHEIGNISVTYGANFQPDGNGYLCVYGRTAQPYIEYYIVESWGFWRPPGASLTGTISVDGGTYEIFETMPTGLPEIFTSCYWSVRTSKRTSGVISVSEHFKKWESLGMTMGNLYDVTFCVEGYQSSGNAHVYYMSVDIANDDYTEITAPFVQDGAGSYYWKTTSVPNYINSWNLDSLTINGVDFTNTWAPVSSLPAAQSGYYYIECQASYPWSHIEIK